MFFFDLHCHPGLKTLFQPQDGNQVSPWVNISPKDKILGDILESQSSLKMLTEKGDIRLVCITLHPPEIGMIYQVLLGLASLLLFPKLLSGERLDEMVSQECAYQKTFEQELENLIKPPTQVQNPQNKKIKFLSLTEEFNLDTPDTLYVIFNIEGGHTFYDQKNRVKDMSAVLANFDKFLAKKYRVLYFTPTHLTPNEFITHAYGNKILTKGPLLPKGIGITPFGKQFLEHAYAKNVLVDIKHMSLVSRRLFYKFRKEHFPNMPIIASHVGFTGNYWKFFKDDVWFPVKKSYGYKMRWLVQKGVIEGTAFYPLSINLYNEDLKEILASNGLIGISLDIRILGGKEKAGTEVKDFYSHEEFELLTGTNPEAEIEKLYQALNTGTINNGNVLLNTVNPEPQETEDIKGARTELAEMATETTAAERSLNYNNHLRLVLNHILHIYKLTRDEGLKAPWDNLCIGSDFDGLVEAVHCCTNATAFGDFAKSLTQALQSEIDNGFEYKPNLSAEEIIDKIMFRNAHDFIARHFKN